MSNKVAPHLGLIQVLLFLILGLPSCNTGPIEMKLDERYGQIQGISTQANCMSPQGPYTTQVESNIDGSCVFTQQFSPDEPAFIVHLTSNNEGYIMNEEGATQDTLSNLEVEMIRGHEFHMIHTNPHRYFENITFESSVDNEVAIFSAEDQSNRPVKIYYNSIDQLIVKTEQLNPLDTTQLIEVYFNQWEAGAFGMMVKELQIIQAQKDTFYFDFDRIIVR